MEKRVKLSDYIVSFLIDHGIRDAFMVTGGGAMHLNESFGSNPRLTYWCTHHEQAAAFAAEGFTRLTGTIAPVQVTSGPGGTNALTGLIGMWLDSIPGLYISGQSKLEMTVGNTRLRQIGLQELPIVDVVKSITKYAVMITDPTTVRYHLEKALYLATSGRPGPSWIDVPLDIQAAMIDPDKLPVFDPGEIVIDVDSPVAVKKAVEKTVKLFQTKKRPVILAGNGIRLSGAENLFLKLAERLNIPVLTAVTAHDLIPSDHPLFFGRPALFGERIGNFIVQNCDLLISIGTRLSTWTISYADKTFAREATHVMVDIDRAELTKKTLHPDIPVCADAKVFIEELDRQTKGANPRNYPEWFAYCRRIRKTYPPVNQAMHDQKKFVNSYHFIDMLSDAMKEGDVIVTGDGTAFTCTYQAIRLKKHQRLICNIGSAPMGYDISAAIGACIANGRKRVVCIAGDGSIQLNIQELQTIVYHKLPIKIFLINNDGYVAIRTTQKNFFNHLVGESPKTGISFPDMKKISHAYGIPFARISTHAGLKKAIDTALGSPGPYMLELMVDPWQPLVPKVTSMVGRNGKLISKPMEDMWPFLPRKEFNQNMLIKPLKED
ncbi:MAG TPA: thiamine pyrophosphate-binding protein [Patescibacteria group bacterium]|nr:thiamine pyrophosphate-binding protein [Patescibacteria group bacterium]